MERYGKYEDLVELITQLHSLPEGERPVSSMNLNIISSRLSRLNRIQRALNIPKITPSVNSGPLLRETRNTQIAKHLTQWRKNKSRGRLSEYFEDGHQKSWSAIVCLWKRKDYIVKQISAISNQSIRPVEIICLINENHFASEELAYLRNKGCKVIKSDVNSLYTRWAISYICKGRYVCIFDDDTIPGTSYIENAIRCCAGYKCLVGAAGRIYDPLGMEGLYKIVAPTKHNDNFISCAEEDVFCDWVCNSYLFDRAWVPSIIDEMALMESFSTHDDMQAALSAFRSMNIGCVVPYQPNDNPALSASLYPEYGSDSFAVWLNHRSSHFQVRKDYIRREIGLGRYLPVKARSQTFFHIIIPYGSRVGLDWCLRSVAAQTYSNYRIYLIDDCQDNAFEATHNLVASLGFPASRVSLIVSKKKAYPLLSRCIAYETMVANRSDVVIHLDGDDFLTRPDVFIYLDSLYSGTSTKLTHGGSITVTTPIEHYGKAGQCLHSVFSETWRSVDWCYKTQNPTRKLEKEGRIIDSLNKENLESFPWGHMHLRSHRYYLWEEIDKSHFVFEEEYLKAATDMAIFLPMLVKVDSNEIFYIDRIVHAYSRFPSGTTTQDTVSDGTKMKYVSHIVSSIVDEKPKGRPDMSKAKLSQDFSVIKLHDYDEQSWGLHDIECKNIRSRLKHRNHYPAYYPLPGAQRKLAIFSIVTPDYLADGIIAVKSLRDYGRLSAAMVLFISGTEADIDETWLRFAKLAGITLLFKKLLKSKEAVAMCEMLLNKYNQFSDEFRWSMKSVICVELLTTEYSQVIFTDPDTLTVSPLSEVFQDASEYGLYLFPHFRHYDCEWSRKTLYEDGFYNGGLFSATPDGLRIISRWFKRCLARMEKSPVNNTFVDQKYLDTATYEDSSVGHNLDRGVDFNTWNNEEVQLVSPTLSSYLLEGGHFVRHWHFTVGMIDASVKGGRRHTIFDSAIIKYCTLRLVLLLALSQICTSKTNKSLIKNRIDRNKGIIEKLFSGPSGNSASNLWGAFNLVEMSDLDCASDELINFFCIKGPLFEYIDLVGEVQLIAAAVVKQTQCKSEGRQAASFSKIVHMYSTSQTVIESNGYSHHSGAQLIAIDEMYRLGSTKSFVLESAKSAGLNAETYTSQIYKY